MGFGKLPSLARLLARHRQGWVTILPVELVLEGIHGGSVERRWVISLRMTLNQLLPFGGMNRIRWHGPLAGYDPTNVRVHSVVADVTNTATKHMSLGLVFF